MCPGRAPYNSIQMRKGESTHYYIYAVLLIILGAALIVMIY